MKKTLYTDPSERTPKILENSDSVRSLIRNLQEADFVDETNYVNGEEFIFMISPFGVAFHYEYFRNKPQISLYGTLENITRLEKVLTEKFFAKESAQTTLK